MYKRLLPLFHHNETEWKKLYHSLYDSPLTRHFDISIKQMNATKEYKAFFCYTEDLCQLLSSISYNSLQLSRTISKIPPVAVNQFERTCLVDEIKATNEIEGVNSTRREIRNAMDLQDDCNAHNVRLWSIVNKYDKLQHMENIPFATNEDLRAFYDSFVLDEVIRSNPENEPDGHIFRKGSVDVESGVKLLHRGLFPESRIIEAMGKALMILQDSEIPPLVRLSIFHYLFGYIHPFYDGNGRTSRFITSYYLARILNPLVALRLSLTIKTARRTYYKLFDDTHSFGNAGDMTPFVHGFLRLILATIERTNDLLLEKQLMLERASTKLDSMGLDKTDHAIYYVLLQAALFSDDGASLNEIAQVIGRDPRTISNHMKLYHKDHIIRDTTHRAHRFKLNIGVLQE